MLSLILFILILGSIVTIHEFGHFIFAKIAKTHVYEFSIGMGPKIYGHKKKGNVTEFCVRAIPIGGYVSIAGEDIPEENIPKDKLMCNKNFIERFAILFAGPFNNFLYAFIILFVSALIYGAQVTKPYIGEVVSECGEIICPAYEAGLESGDLVLSIDGKKIKSWDAGLIMLQTSDGSMMTFEVEKSDGRIEKYEITPVKQVDEDGNESYKFGIATDSTKKYGFLASVKYGFNKLMALFASMLDTLKYLFTGRVGVNQLSGPVGIYSIVDSQAEQGLEAILYLMAYLSINVGVINLLPFPAFDGGRILFLIIEKLFKKPIPQKVEAIVNEIGFVLIILLLLYVTGNDILRMFF